MNANLFLRPSRRTRSRFLRRLPALALWFGAALAGLAQPRITRQPTDLSLSIGATATFRVAATTTNGPITYQWRHQDTPLPNATNASLTLTNIQRADAGPYSVAVADAVGTTNSAAAILDVDPTWTKITSDLFVTDPGPEWSTAAWADLDNDGYLDLFVARYDAPGPNPIFHNNGDGTFTRVMEPSLQAIQAEAWTYCWGDFDNDGFLDLATFKHPLPDNSLARYYRNNGNSNTWLNVKCVGTFSPRSAAGTKVRVQATIHGQPMWQLRVIDLGGFVMGQNFTAHFGLGDATHVDVLRIEWTSGVVQELTNVAVQQYLTVTEPSKLEMPRPGELQLQCWKDMSYTIEGSSDLETWTSLISLTNLNLTGGLQWTDPDAATQSVRFYRAQRAEFAHPEALASTEWLETGP